MQVPRHARICLRNSLKQCQPLTIAWSAGRVAYVTNTCKSAASTRRTSSIDPAQLDSRSTARSVDMLESGHLEQLVRHLANSNLDDQQPIGHRITFKPDVSADERLKQLSLEHPPEEDDDGYVITLLARGGYNDVWVVDAPKTGPRTLASQPFVLRVPNEDSLNPYQVRNEVGWLSYMAKHCPDVPVPQVYDFSDGSKDDSRPFIAEEFVEAKALCDVWLTYSEKEKEIVARNLAELTVRLGGLRFDAIGGMNPDGTMGPTVEGVKLFKGRDAFHNHLCYDIGPYASIESYVLACYNKEIYYYSHAPESDIDEDLFEDTNRADFLQSLRGKQAAAKAELDAYTRDEPFVLCHGDLQGRNILMRGTDIAAVIDWEFAGSFPLSELLEGGIEVLEMVDDDTVEECFKWCGKISDLVAEVARKQGWSARNIDLLTCEGDNLIQSARVEMMPEDPSGLGRDDGAESPGMTKLCHS